MSKTMNETRKLLRIPIQSNPHIASGGRGLRRRGLGAVAWRWSLGLGLILAVGVSLTGRPTPGLAQQTAEQVLQKSSTVLQGIYDIEELRRLLQIARETGFSEEQLKQITVEDEKGNVINAYEFIAAEDARLLAERTRLEAERRRVYLSPTEILAELDKQQPADLNQLRDKSIYVD